MLPLTSFGAVEYGFDDFHVGDGVLDAAAVQERLLGEMVELALSV